jgi:hypothetical protein
VDHLDSVRANSTERVVALSLHGPLHAVDRCDWRFGHGNNPVVIDETRSEETHRNDEEDEQKDTCEEDYEGYE